LTRCAGIRNNAVTERLFDPLHHDAAWALSRAGIGLLAGAKDGTILDDTVRVLVARNPIIE
jgi:hypothetical protein